MAACCLHNYKYYIIKMTTIKQTVTDHKNAVILAATVALIIIACAFAVYLRLYTGKELWYEMFAAIIGVIITAIITMMLLVGQTVTRNARRKERCSRRNYAYTKNTFQRYMTLLRTERIPTRKN